MDFQRRLKALAEAQQKLTTDWETLARDAERDPVLDELEKLRQSHHDLDDRYTRLLKKAEETGSERDRLRLALREQILDERLKILKISRARMELFFGKKEGEGTNRLKDLEERLTTRSRELSEQTRKGLLEEDAALGTELADLEERIREAVLRHQKINREKQQGLFADARESYEKLNAEIPDENVIKERSKQNQVEMKIGQNWLNRIGMFLILVAMGIFAFWVREQINAYIKSIIIFVAGFLFMGTGEYLFRKKKELFSTVFIGGGIAILYSAVFFSSFVLKIDQVPILSLNLALLFSILITVLSLVLSLRYNSLTIIHFATVGGFFPFAAYLFTRGFSGQETVWAMIYLLLFQLLILGLSFKKKWITPHLILFLLNAPSLGYLVLHTPSAVFGLVYTVIVFVLYLVAVLAYPFIRREKVALADLILLGLNTVFTTILLYLLLDKLHLEQGRGVLALAFCLIFAFPAWLLTRYRSQDKSAAGLFYLTALAFAVLVIPFQFGRPWISLGWLLEGLLLTGFGFYRQQKKIELGGWIVSGLGVLIFMILDIPWDGLKLSGDYLFSVVPLFDLKYLLFTLSLLILCGIYGMARHQGTVSALNKRIKTFTVLSWFALGNAVIFLLYFTISNYARVVDDWSRLNVILPDSMLIWAMFLLVALVLRGAALGVRKAVIFEKKGRKIASYLLLVFSDLIVFVLVLTVRLMRTWGQKHPEATYILLGILVLVNILAVLDVRTFLLEILNWMGESLEIYPLVLGLALLENLTVLLVFQYPFGGLPLVLCFSYLALALLLIFWGFKKKFLYVRLLGLGLIVVSLVILFLEIFKSTGVGGRIAAFLIFGLVLMGLSWLYHVIQKKEKS